MLGVLQSAMRRFSLALLILAIPSLAPATASAAPAVSVFPTPGSRSALPGTQIVFRGVASASIGSVQVVGSRTGIHAGSVAADSDGQGGSFLPAKPFAAGETVTVTTGLNILGGRGGSFRFTIARPDGAIPPEQIPLVAAGANGLEHFRSRPDLEPASVTVAKRGAPASLGDIFVAPQQGPVQNGPMLLDPSGNLIWFKPLPKNQLATDFRVQELQGQPVLTWWQGYTNNGSGRGEGVIYDSTYRQIAVVNAANGLQGADLHEFLLTPQGQAYIIAASPLRWPGLRKPLMDSVVQEIDIKTGLVLFEWHALDHVPLSESFYKLSSPGFVYDPYHLNSIALDRDGNLIVSLRNTWADYKINHQTGAVMWTLGSNRSSFHLGPGVQTAFQHNLVVQPDGTFTIFDDGAGPPAVHSQSRAIRIAINTKKMTATLLQQYEHSPPLSSIFEGGYQALPGGDAFVGWGSQPYISEFTAAGKLDFDAHFTAPTTSYRAYRFPWFGQPTTVPALAASSGADGVTTVYASWNGATDVASWRVLAGAGPGGLQPVGGAPKRGFETAIPVHSEQPEFEVQALGSSGQVLSSSGVLSTGTNRISIFGHSAFISPGGMGGLPVGCFSPRPCRTSATVSAGRTVIARAGSQYVPPGGGGTVLFMLSGSGRSMLSRARGHQLSVSVTARDSDGASSSTDLNLVPYHTSGSGPRYIVKQGATLQILTKMAFVSPTGVGGVFAGCFSSQPCHVSTVVTAGGTVIARTGSEFLGAEDCGTLIFDLTPAGSRMLAHARGNQLAATVTVTSGANTATATMPLVRWG